MFDNNDVEKNPKVTPNDSEVEDCNIRTKQESNIIKISKSLAPEHKEKYIILMKEFWDVFAWIYEELKVCDTNIIQHTIPIKENEKYLK
jgi:hypothetical protein